MLNYSRCKTQEDQQRLTATIPVTFLWSTVEILPCLGHWVVSTVTSLQHYSTELCFRASIVSNLKLLHESHKVSRKNLKYRGLHNRSVRTVSRTGQKCFEQAACLNQRTVISTVCVVLLLGLPECSVSAQTD